MKYYSRDYSRNGYRTIIVGTLLIVMLSLMVGGRWLSRRLQKASLGADDYSLLVATLLCYALCGLAIYEPRIGGFGTLVDIHSSMASQISIAWLVLYGVAIAVSKCSILLLYVRVFTTINRAFTSVGYLMAFITIAMGIVQTFGVVFRCQPVQVAWLDSPGGSCINLNDFERYTAIPNIVTGLVMLIMPLPLIWQLKVSPAAKVALTATFLHGSSGLVSSIARLVQLFKPSADANDTTIAWTIWTVNEPVNYIIAACLPTLRPLFVRVLPASFFLASRSNTRPYSTPKEAKSRSYFKKASVNVAITDPRFSGPWHQYGVEPPATVHDSSERDLVAADFFQADGHEKVTDLENGCYLVTRTVEMDSHEQSAPS